MEMKDNLSSCSDSEEQEIQLLQIQAKILKEVFMNKYNELKTTIQHLSNHGFPMTFEFKRAFQRLFCEDERTFKFELDNNMKNLETQLNKETLQEKDSKSTIRVINAHSILQILDTQHLNSIEKCIVERARHEQEIQNRLNERKLQIQECKVQEVKTSDASSGDTYNSGIVSDKGNDQSLENQSNTFVNESSRSRNECNERNISRDDTDIKPSYDTEPMAEVPYNVEYNVFVVETQ
ncbi:hypothetical protein Tco_1288753 [Tanacetum coccineum]